MKISAGLLVYRQKNGRTEVLLVHPGGPFWVRKDIWGIPKGEYEPEEDPLSAAKREFTEEIGQPAPEGDYIELGQMARSDGRPVLAWAVEGDIDPAHITSNTIFIDWPPRSGKQLEVPEVDKAKWFDINSAPKMHGGQEAFVRRLAEHLGQNKPSQPQQSSLF